MEITRGDYKKFKFQRKDKDNNVITDIPEEIYITFKASTYKPAEVLFQKRLSTNEIIYDEETSYYSFAINPEDTNELHYGDYYYDIEIKNGDRPKTINKGILNITYEVTFADDEV